TGAHGHLRAVPEVHHRHVPHRDARRDGLQRHPQPGARYPGPRPVRQVHDGCSGEPSEEQGYCQ
ncbi:hypothetical protein ACJX0J_034980, partial [Zea mays]